MAEKKLRTKELKGIGLIYACSRQMGGTDDEFRSLNDLGLVAFAGGVIIAAKIATWCRGDEWRAACPGQDGYYDDELGIVDMGSCEGTSGDSPIDAGMRAYLLHTAGSTVEDLPDWLSGYKP